MGLHRTARLGLPGRRALVADIEAGCSLSGGGETLRRLADSGLQVVASLAREDGRVGGRRQHRAAWAGWVASFLPPPIEPGMRFSRTRLTDVFHRRHSACRATPGSGAGR